MSSRLIDKTPDWTLLKNKKRFIIAFSGGIDSTFLLSEMVTHFGNEACLAVYFDHGLRSKEDQANEREIIQKTVMQLGVTGIIRILPVHAYIKRHGCSAEEAGRYLRYDLLSHFKKRHRYDAIVTAHHQDDSAESFMMQLGSGALLGAQGITPHMLWRKTCDIYHPLWQYRKSEIREAFQRSGLQHSEDQTNTDTALLRNNLRHKLIPVAEEIFPQFTEKVVRFGNFITTVSDYIAKKIPTNLKVFQYESDSLTSEETSPRIISQISLDGFDTLDPIEQEWLARYWLMQSIPPKKDAISAPHTRFSTTHIQMVIRVALNTTPRSSLPGEQVVWHEYGKLCFAANTNATKSPLTRTKNLTIALKEGPFLFEKLGLRLDIDSQELPRTASFPEKWKHPWVACIPQKTLKKGELLRIRERNSGDRFHPLGMKQSMSLKRYLIHRKFPARWRGHLPLFFLESELVWVPFLGLSDRFRRNPSQDHDEDYFGKTDLLWVLTLSPLDKRFQPVFNHYNWM
jgi:tRNA(Ile)-lysidine synthase